MAKPTKDATMTMRLPAETLRTLEMIAASERKTTSEIIRRAIDQYLNPERKENE